MSFVCETHQESIPIELLKGYFSRNGFLLCNECRNMPSLFNVGGDWNSIVQLIEEGQVFIANYIKVGSHICPESSMRRLNLIASVWS